MGSVYPKADRVLFQTPEVRKHLIAATKQAVFQGTKGLAYECRLFTRPWVFRLEDISCDSLYLWHGEQDAVIPVSIARFVADSIPNCRTRFYPNDGHLSVPYTYPEEIWKTMNF